MNPTRHSEFHTPAERSLRIFAFDPSMDLDLETARINRTTVQIPWEEPLGRGPVGEYVEVVDVDPASECRYEPVDLNHPHLLAQDGLPPSEGDPGFHQQMVYAVAMKTINNFETALGRSVHWSPRSKSSAPKVSEDQRYVARLRIYPHALREANAYYSPEKKALLFGYFNAANVDAREGLPGGIVFGCLSHDIIAHETTHAILDGIHRRLLEASNPDVLAFHEAFADVVAIFQHFTLPGVLQHEIGRTRGGLDTENLLSQLAVQFGRATRRGNALRDALGAKDGKTGVWKRFKADPDRIASTFEPHERGALLVAAIFHAFLALYRGHTEDLLRIATGGSGVLPKGALHPDLVARLAEEAAKVAQRLLTMCIRALDYLPPVDVTFGDFLRALITIDSDLVPVDSRHYRTAIISSFRDWGIYPRDVRTLSVESLRWKSPTREEQRSLQRLLPPANVLRAMAFAQEYSQFPRFRKLDEETRNPSLDMERLTADLLNTYQQSMPRECEAGAAREDRRKDEYLRERQFARYLHEYLEVQARERSCAPGDREIVTDLLGVDPFAHKGRFEVHAIRPTTRVRRDGRSKSELLVLITQCARNRLKGTDARDSSDGDGALHYKFRGGCTLLIDPESGKVNYSITKRINGTARQELQEQFLRERLAAEGLDARARYGVRKRGDILFQQETFRLLHRGAFEEEWV